ncbi:MAG: glycine zipper domain-containing protein [Methylobacter sp.]|nr:glycine zipper domain-containing protein [Methylobacter sp.]MDP1663511.1 glycine zipper domain-containing protein [Methylobacter sp.]
MPAWVGAAIGAAAGTAGGYLYGKHKEAEQRAYQQGQRDAYR